MRVYRNILILLFILVLPVSLFASSVTDLSKSISVAVPEKWKPEQPSGLSKLTLLNPENGANILVLSQKVGEVSLQQCEKAWLDSIKSMEDFKMLSRKNSRLGSKTARELVFTTVDKSGETPVTLKFVQLLMVRSKTLYAVQFVCAEPVYEDNITAFYNVRSSFKFLR